MLSKKEIHIDPNVGEKAAPTLKLFTDCYDNIKHHLKIDLNEKKILDPLSDTVF